MARTEAGAQLTAAHRQGQLRVRAQALRDYMRIWPLWTGDGESFDRLLAASVPVLRAHHSLSTTLASSYLQSFRAAERAGGPATPRIAQPLDEGRIRGSLFVTGLEMTRKALAAGFTPEAAMQSALVRTSGTVTRLVLAGGRDTIVSSSDDDREARGWARVTAATPCAFCAMLASRGPSYTEDGADFEAHDHCSCAAEPHYEGSDWPGRGREFKQLWNEHAKGDDTAARLNAFRQALAGNAG